MRQVNATDFKTHFGDFVDLVRDEPIEVLRGSKPVGVFVSRDEYEHIQSLDDAYWIARVEAVEAEGRWIGHDKAIDTMTPAGRMMMQMVGSFAEFEREMLRERTKAGLRAARREGHVGGRRLALKPEQQQEGIRLVTKGDKTPADAARLFRVHPSTVSRQLQRNQAGG